MTQFEKVTREDVLGVLEEYDDQGGEAFLEEHGFGPSRDDVLWHDTRSYDSKAVLGVAHGRATGVAAGSDDFRGGKDGAAHWLRELGFEVSGPDAEADTDTDTAQTAADIGPEAARTAWADAAREVLEETARRYHEVVTHQHLSAEVQTRSGVTTAQRPQHWISDVLGRVSAECARRDEPLLSSLCVNAGGSVGDGYAAAVLALTGEQPEDPDAHAARQRHACHVHFGAHLPAGGGGPALTAKLRAARTRSRKAEREARPVPLCPTCNMALPATGVCDTCG